MDYLPGHLVREIVKTDKEIYAFAHTSKYYKELFNSELSAILLNRFVIQNSVDFVYFIPDNPLELLHFLQDLFEDYGVTKREIVIRLSKKYERASRQSKTVDALVPSF